MQATQNQLYMRTGFIVGMSGPIDNGEAMDVNDESRLARNAQTPHPRAVGSPLPRGSARHSAYSAEPENQLAPPPPGRSLPQPAADDDHVSSGVQRAVNALRNVVPFVQRILPLLDGNFATAVANVLTPQSKPMAPVNLAPIEEGVAELQVQQRELQDQVIEQHTSIKRVEGQLEMVREATDRNTLEQQELMEDLKAVGTKVNVVALVALAMLAISVLLNLVLYLHIQRVLP